MSLHLKTLSRNWGPLSRELYPDAKDRFLEINPVDLNHEECDLEKAYGLIAQVKPSIDQGMWVDFRSLIKASNKP